ncbi:MAG: DUF465 domain-containing protein, partial [Pseudomonadota bacterium]|nr:DUF465 domain-containing protein [Pseudomonadota bacterium]
MALDAHLVELADRHRMLEKKIESEMARPSADEIKIAEWKKKKLQLK